MLLGQRGGIIAFALLDLHHLSGAGFAAHAVLQAGADTPGGAARLQHFHHCLFDIFEVAAAKGNGALGFGLD